MKKLGITADCVCDLPEKVLRAHDVDIMYFYIVTDTGVFRDGCGVTSTNILEYLEEGGRKAETSAPEAVEYKGFFERNLSQFDELIHISISDRVSASYRNAKTAVELMGKSGGRVTVIDSQSLSTGMGHLVLRAVALRDEGRTAQEIAQDLLALRAKVSASFITLNTEALRRNSRIGNRTEKLCDLLSLHPVLTVRRGRMRVRAAYAGDYEKSILRYIRRELRRGDAVDRGRLFITHAGCPVKLVSQIGAEVQRLCAFDEVVVTSASATVSCNCGPGTVGMSFVYR